MQCRRLSPGEIRHTAGQTTKLSRHNGSKITRYIFRKPVPDINLTGIHPAMYKKLMAFFNLTAALDSYDSVYILANSAGGWSEQICLKENDLVIAFNHHPRYLIDCDKCDLVVLQRQYSDSELYQGYHQDLSFRQHKIFYGIILNHAAMLNIDHHIFGLHQMVLPVDIIPYSINTEKEPSSGFALLSVLYHFWCKNKFLKNIKPVGFQFSDSGWEGHDWEYERFQASQMTFGW